MCLTEGIVRDLSGLNGCTKPWSCYPQELMPTEHIVALLIAERDKLLGCRSLTRELFLAFLATVPPLLRFRKVRVNTETGPWISNRGLNKITVGLTGV